jgi:hypothetical protein
MLDQDPKSVAVPVPQHCYSSKHGILETEQNVNEERQEGWLTLKLLLTSWSSGPP